MNYTIKNEHYTLTVSDMGAEMKSLLSPCGFEFLWQGDPAKEDYWQMSAPVLFPLCGNVPNNKYIIDGKEHDITMHGFALSSRFDLTEKTDTSIKLTLKSNEETKKVYPRDFTLTLAYTLVGDSIKVAATVRNESEKDMPHLLGFHPGFNLPTDEGQDNEDYLLDFGALEKLTWCPSYMDGKFITSRVFDYELNDGKYHINEDEILRNDTMIFTNHEHRVKLYAPNHPYRLEMEWSDTLPTLCIWKQEVHEAKMLCVEPWCYFSKDGSNNGNYDIRPMPTLKPQELCEYSFKLKISL